MEVLRAAVMGRCMGVRRAVDLALETAARGEPVYSLGPLIHNPQAVAELAEKGVVALSESELDGRVRNRAVVIRAHGVPPELRERLAFLGARIVDATCPRVIASQQKARDFAERGYTVILAGDRDHAEIQGIAGYVREGIRAGGGHGGCAIVGSPEEASRMALPPPETAVAVIAQTTIKGEEYHAICEVLAARLPGLEIVDSICPATEERRRALAELAERCEALVVVGGRNSANTSRLYRSALALGKPAWQVETAAELPPEIFSYGKVGITAGASTPEDLIAHVESTLLDGEAGPAGADARERRS
jgi:4-hydroxy-3-methylbut-2-enyl diphosphate reductase